MPENLKDRLSKEFSSIEILKSEMLATAYSMFGPGFVWLVRTNATRYQSSSPRQFKILTTYLAGSPLAGAHNRRQPLDMNVHNVGSAELAGGLKGLSEAEFRRQTEPQNHVGFATNKNETSFGGVNVTPVLCVNTWEHAWMFDYSISGKMEYLNRWWDVINWDIVLANSGISSDQRAPGLGAFSHNSFHRR
jgi:Fe-Mn family superoxide dismutase